ncbi:ABC transporter substrate-binding protein [Mangrovactinospora gilvigrisea]|uniref:ABC transporter substrate-binding protein n=1 Tax=Mangrovactinospora gilvigrisea TaxID=1428644 RepID=A0A1J7BIF2_9ACTN|nr:ABC transporter substrate-binding protein [Mangrovactinospora gilvigrisea]OIV38422.1 ABC transporter substrate-binding protein [Mangrovactinospora gilvigrisea]
MSRSRTITALAAAGTALAMASISACGSSSGGGSGSGSSGGKGGVVLGTTDSVTALDPAGAYDHGSWEIILNVYQTLLTIPAGQTKPVPDAAKSCAFTNPSTYSCTLKSAQKFSNGDALTSKDVKFTFDRLAKINDPNGPASIFQGLKSTDAPSPTQVVFHLAAPDATFPQRLATGGGALVDAKVFPADKLLADAKVVGSGPYQVKSYTPKQIAQFTPNKDYGGSLKLANSQFVIQYFSEPSAMRQAVEQKKADIAYRTFSPTDINSLSKESAKGLKVYNSRGTEKRYLVLDSKKGPTAKKAVRQAIASLIDRNAIASNVWDGTVKPLYGMVGIGVEGHTDPFKQLYGATPSKAKATALLKTAGYSAAKPVPLALWYTPTHYGPTSVDEFTLIQRQLNASGLFKVSLHSTEWNQYQKDEKAGQYPAYEIGWFPDFPDADNDYAPFYSKDTFLYTGYNNPAVQKLIGVEQGTTDVAKRNAAFTAAEKLTAADAPIVPLWQGNLNAVANNTVSGVQQALDPQFFRFNLVSRSGK